MSKAAACAPPCFAYIASQPIFKHFLFFRKNNFSNWKKIIQLKNKISRKKKSIHTNSSANKPEREEIVSLARIKRAAVFAMRAQNIRRCGSFFFLSRSYIINQNQKFGRIHVSFFRLQTSAA